MSEYLNATEFVLRTRGLTKHFSGFTAVDNVELRVRRGTIHAVIGPNGAGKTTLFNLLTRFLEPSSGQIYFEGQDVTSWRPAELARAGVVRSFQISAIFPRLTVLENVRVALQRELGTTFHFWRSDKSLAVLRDKAIKLLEDVDLGEFADTSAVDLPYGRRRALEIATTLAMNPSLMLLDEPTAGMGHEDIDLVTELIRKVSTNRTIVMVEHNLSVVADLSDTITVMQRGSVLTEGTYEIVSKNADVLHAYMGVEDE